MGHFRPKIEAEIDETLSQYFQDVVKRHQSSHLHLRRPEFRPLHHPINLFNNKSYIAKVA
jgi:hypothetical protein